MTNQWMEDGPFRWCRLQPGGAALMLQYFGQAGAPDGKLGRGVSVCFQCKDALAIYREVTSPGIQAQGPFVGNAMWVTVLSDPDGCRIKFESPIDVAEETEYSEPNG